MVTERQSQILHTIIEEYIDSATPVSSGVVFEQGGLRVSCPTIRNEMADLTQLGYLTQPHTSAGRVPTEQGYRFFVDALLAKNEEKLQKKINTPRGRRVRIVVEYVAPRTRDIVLFIDRNGQLQYIGLKNVLENPEFETRASVISLINELERLERSIDRIFREVHTETKVFIGSENPFFEHAEYSMLLSALDDGFVSLIGPMRMNYRRNLALLE